MYEECKRIHHSVVHSWAPSVSVLPPPLSHSTQGKKYSMGELTLPRGRGELCSDSGTGKAVQPPSSHFTSLGFGFFLYLSQGSFVLQLLDVSIYLSLSSHSKKKKKKKHQERTMGNGEVMPNWGAVFCGVRHIWQEEIFPEDTDFGSGELGGSSGLLINIHKNSSLPPLCAPCL